MIAMHMFRLTLLGFLLAGCSTQLLEEVGEVTAPRLCSETTKLFNTFSMHATRIAWKGDKGAPSATLTLELAFQNDKDFPIALSNSGNGVLYTVQFSLQGGKGDPIAPKEASGVVLVREPKKFKEPPRPGPFGFPPRHKPSTTSTTAASPPDNTRDVNYRIDPGKPENAKLVFQAPRDSYLLVIERKFANKPVAGQPTDHIAVCKIAVSEAAALRPAGPEGIAGVY